MDCCGHEGPGGGDAKFEIHKVADGVWAAVAAPAFKVNCNTAIIENSDGVMVVDTHSKPSAARVIVDKLRDITKKPVRYVVNTHFHWDHWHGNEVYPAAYPDAEIVTNQITREAMIMKGLKRIQDHVRQVPAGIARRSSTSPTSSWATATWPGASGSRPSGATSTTWSRRSARKRRPARPSTRSSSASAPSWRRGTRSCSRPTATTGRGARACSRTSSARSRW